MTTTHRPTHRVFAVTKNNDEDKGFWHEIGAAWAHQDGQGYAVKLHLMPTSSATEIVIRRIAEVNSDIKATAKKGGAA